MSILAQEIAEMVDMLPQEEQVFAKEIIKKLVIAWDPDFTKLTPQEEKELQQAREEFARGEYVRHEDIDWD
ncbi:MAG: hypothetical protein FWF57_02790 [Defluviitaleaceae bacterium]|nr:hypothetical protein [Defluviitaleaceae bacterium]